MKTLVAGAKQGEAGEKCSESEMIEGKAQEGKPAVGYCGCGCGCVGSDGGWMVMDSR